MPPGTAPTTARRVFLGWERPALQAAAAWLQSEWGDDLGDKLVALPGGRAVRRLVELLARGASPGWRPPRVLTQGALVDELVRLERPVAGRLARTLAWQRALASLPEAELERLARGAARRRDREAQLRLAETVRGLHGALAPEGLEFADLLKEGRGPAHEGERARWRILARVQEAWRRELDAAGLEDPHEGRRTAIEFGQVDATREVVLVGVADMNELLAATLERLGGRVTALIAAPEDRARGFDALGRLVPSYWNEQPVPLDARRWFVEEKPADQADRALDCIAHWAQDRPAEEITVGIADEEVVPFLERRLRSAGARLRVAAGTPLARTRPYRLLRAVASFVERRGFGELAALARHPDVAARIGTRSDPAAVLDRYHREHLPRGGGGPWAGPAEETRGVQALSRRLGGLLGDLGKAGARPLGRWADAIRGLLARVYGKVPLDPEVEDQRILAGALALVGAALEELEQVPAAIAGEALPAHGALRLLLRGLRAETVAPAPARAGEPTVEALGWLELPLDDAPALVVTGFEEGRVPRSIQGDPFLPDGLRARLGLPDDAARLARDVYATHVLLATRERCAFVTGRRAGNGDPLVPSRIAFLAPPAEVVQRVRRFLPPPARREPAEDAAAVPSPELARAARTPAVASMSVTSFKTFLESPYRFYLERVLRLRTLDDRARELDPLRFGSFAHDVLETFGRSDLRDSYAAGEIEELLVAEARRLALERFGAEPLPAVALQLEQLVHRLRRVAAAQAERRAEGWRILRVEWQAEEGHPFPVEVGPAGDGEAEPMRLTGKIDRIDVHADGRWAVLDYKTGESGKGPEEVARNRKTGAWLDLQLPLYREIAAPLAREHGLTGAPELGYFLLGKDEEHSGVRIAAWTEEDHDSALECARDVVRRVRAGDFFERGRGKVWEPILAALLGQGLLDLGDGAEEDEA